MGLFAKIKSGLKKTRQGMSNSVRRMLHSFTKIDEDLYNHLTKLKNWKNYWSWEMSVFPHLSIYVMNCAKR